jgi:hypothetical protein
MKLGPHGKESFLTAPLITESAELVGVLQLRDKRSVLDELVTSFDEADELVLPAFLLHVANALANALQLVRMKLRDDANKVLQVASPRITSELEFVGLSRAVAEQGKLLFSVCLPPTTSLLAPSRTVAPCRPLHYLGLTLVCALYWDRLSVATCF